MKKTILHGIDEAGYGPILGPLVVARMDFELSEDSGSVVPAPGAGGFFRVDDSKRVLSGARGFGQLEKTVLAFATAWNGGMPSTVEEWIRLVDPGSREDLGRHPWYEDLSTSLPLMADPDEVARGARAVESGAAFSGATFLGGRLSVVSEGAFNTSVAETGNKHDTLFGLVADLVGSGLERPGSARFMIDRLGGRRRYSGKLAYLYPFNPLAVEVESREESRYMLDFSGRSVEFSFLVRGDQREYVIALASMFAKYAREILMGAFNSYWQAAIPGIRATAGYHTDGLRFLRDLEERHALPGDLRTRLVRSR